jgi:hypothetical protein
MTQEASNCQPEHTQRVQVSLERSALRQRVKIEVESHDPVLGWYTSGALALPLEHLPMLEQAIEEMRRCPDTEEYGKIIPFPGTLAA